MKLSSQNRRMIREDGFDSEISDHTQLLAKVTTDLERQLSYMHQAQQKVFHGAIAFILAPLAKFVPLPYSYETALATASIWAWENGKDIYDERPEYLESFKSAIELFDWVCKSDLDCANAEVQNFTLLMAPLVNKNRLDKLERLTQGEKSKASNASDWLSMNTVKNIAVGTIGLFSNQQTRRRKEALPESFFKGHIATKIREARNVSLERYLYGEDGTQLNTEALFNQGVQYVKNTIPGANMLMPGR